MPMYDSVCLFSCLLASALGMDDTRMDLSQFDEGGARSIPTTPVPQQLTAPGQFYQSVSVCLSISLSVCLSIGLYICLSISIYLMYPFGFEKILSHLKKNGCKFSLY